MRLWVVSDARSPKRAVNLEAFIGLELNDGGHGAWQVLGLLTGSKVVLFEGGRASAEAGFEEALGILTGHRAPYGVTWTGCDDAPGPERVRLGAVT